MDRLNKYQPISILLLVALGIMTATSYSIDRKYFVVWSLVWLFLAIMTVIVSIKFSSDNNSYYNALRGLISLSDDTKCRDLPLPVAVCDTDGTILWSNQLFLSQITENMNENMFELLPDIDFKNDELSRGYNVSIEGHGYTAYATKLTFSGKSGYQIIFFDDNTLKEHTRQYFDSRPNVMIFQIDNYAELFANVRENERSRIVGEIEHILDAFAEENRAMVRRVDKDTYIAVIADKYMRELTAGKFRILDDIRGINTNTRYSATFSAGVSGIADDFYAGEAAARQALDMALGRGGDQVALKQKNGYEFFGGVGKGVEKRSKVRTRIVAEAINEAIASASDVVVMGHRFSDLDSAGAALGMCCIMRDIDKPVRFVINQSTSLAMPLISRMLEDDYYKQCVTSPAEALEAVSDTSLLIVVDTHAPTLVESMEIYNRCKNVIVIDHHRKMVNHIDNSLIFFHEPAASSTCEMVTELVQYMRGQSHRILVSEAEALLSGIMLDTKNFTIRAGVRTFEAAAYLRSMGADTVEVKKLFASSIDEYKNRVKLVSAAEVYKNFAITTGDVSMNTDDVRIVAAQAADELLSIQDVKASFVIYEMDGGVSISARSLGEVNVQVIMESLGGGGHQTMAAVQLTDVTLEICRQQLLIAIDEYLGKEERARLEAGQSVDRSRRVG